MAVSLTAMRSALMPGVILATRSSEPLGIADIPSIYPNLINIFAAVPITKIGSLMKIPDRIVGADGTIYERALEFAGREYPQGWGRGPGGAAAEPPPEPDGKVDTFRWVDNEAMSALRSEVSSFLDGVVHTS